MPAMDAALRHVAHALLVGVDEKQVMEYALQVGRSRSGQQEENVVSGLCGGSRIGGDCAGVYVVLSCCLAGVYVSFSLVLLLQVQEAGDFNGAAVVASAAYLRDRVGVPRDLKLPAARQLRAHLNWLIGALQQQAA